jgi:hypothetical protein
MTTTMTTKDKVARRKLSLLEIAAELSNVNRVCKLMGYSGSNSTKSGGISRPMGRMA